MASALVEKNFANRPNEKGLLVLIKVKRAQQFGDGSAGRVLFVGNAKTQVGSVANQASRNVSDLVLPAPKTPATASVDRPDCKAETRDRAMDII